MHAYLIRHAHAGTRAADRHDIYRPLSERGQERADELVTVLAQTSIRRLLSSPATRCTQTLQPLAAARGLEVTEHSELWEDAMALDALALIEANLDSDGSRGEDGGGVVACSHGNIIPEILDILDRRGVPISGRGCEKGSVWVLSHDGKNWTGARYLKQALLPTQPAAHQT